jgi:mRNA-degrading endonuclease RelE of RelBE toxin-antitoxin system
MTAPFVIRLTKSAADDMDSLAPAIRKRIVADIRGLESDPYRPGPQTKKLTRFRPPLFRLRSGDFRVLFRIQERTILILRVIDRKNLERIIKRLNFRKEKG